jgi:iron complex outermembrane receptor protein
LAGAVTLALQGPAFAEESTIVVTGAEQGSALPAWTNSATKSAGESKTPQVITTLSAPEIEQASCELGERDPALCPGRVDRGPGNTSYMSEYKIRGFTVDQEFYNGLQLPYNVTGNTKARIDPLLIDSVDILKGPHRCCTAGARRAGW